MNGYLALDLLRVLLAHLMLLGIEMPLVSPPPIGIKLRDAKRCQQLLKLQEDGVLPSPEHIRQDLPCVMINRVPQPAWVRFAAYVTPHFVQLCGEPPTAIQFLKPADFYLHLFGMQAL